MSTKINFYKTLVHDDVKRLNTSTSFSFYYVEDSKRKKLNHKEDGQFISLESEDGEWDCEKDGIGIECNIIIDNVAMLFEKGIVYDDSELGLCCLWNSVESKQKGILGVEIIKKQEVSQVFHYEKFFNSKTYYGSIELEFVLVLMKESIHTENPAINNTLGVRLGELCLKMIKLDGSGSIFPIVNINDKKGPLWAIVMDYGDPSQDLFCDAVKIELNIAHKDYKYIDLKNKDYFCNRLVNEIVCNAIIKLFLKLKIDKSLDNLEAQTCCEGSVLQVIKYLIETKGFRTDSVETISDSISRYFETKGV